MLAYAPYEFCNGVQHLGKTIIHYLNVHILCNEFATINYIFVN